MKSDSYILIQGWMINELNLKSNTLLIFAIIYGYSKDSQGKFDGSINYLCKSTGASKNTVLKSLSDLLDLGLILKETINITNITFCKYFQNEQVVQKLIWGGAEIGMGGGAEIAPNNTNINNTNIKIRETQFKTSILEFKNNYSNELLKSFFDYWTEPNITKTKMKFELERTFEISRRLVTWDKNDKKFNNGKSTITNTDEFKQIIKAIESDGIRR